MNEHPAKLGSIGIGVLLVLLPILRAFLPGQAGAPTAGPTDILAIIMQISGIVTVLMGVFADLKKTIPPQIWTAVEQMIATKKINFIELIAIISGKYGKVDAAAIQEIMKRLKDAFQTFKGEDLGPADALDVIPATDDDITRQILLLSTRYEARPVSQKLAVGGKTVISLEVTDSIGADPSPAAKLVR
jgi:hypothetical protein